MFQLEERIKIKKLIYFERNLPVKSESEIMRISRGPVLSSLFRTCTGKRDFLFHFF